MADGAYHLLGAQTAVAPDGSSPRLRRRAAGVTVTLRGAGAPPTPVVTDESGRYLSGWMPPGVYVVDFSMPGFESQTVTNIPLGAGQTVVLDQQLALASLKETVEVTATAPAPKPPPAPPRPVRPTAKPVDREILASGGGRGRQQSSPAIVRIVRTATIEPELWTGRPLQIDARESQCVTTGQNLVVMRRVRPGPPRGEGRTFAEQTAVLVRSRNPS